MNVEVYSTNKEAQKSLAYLFDLNAQVFKHIITSNLQHLIPTKTPPSVILAYVAQLQVIEMDGDVYYDFYENIINTKSQKVCSDSHYLEEMITKIHDRISLSKQAWRGVNFKPFFYTVQDEQSFEVSANRSIVHSRGLDTAIMPTSIFFRGFTERDFNLYSGVKIS